MKGHRIKLLGYSNEPWTISELRWQDSLVCRALFGNTNCSSSDIDYNKTRIDGIHILTDINRTTTGFVIPQINANETGVWTITMIKVLSDLTTAHDEKDITTVVSREAITRLTVEDDETENLNYTTSLGAEVRLVCSGSEGRPEVFSYAWDIDNNTWSNISFSGIQYCSSCNDPDCIKQNCRFIFFLNIVCRYFFYCRDSNESVQLVASVPGDHTINCTPIQSYSFPEMKQITIHVILLVLNILSILANT